MKKSAWILLIIIFVILVCFFVFIFVKYARENPENTGISEIDKNSVLEIIDGDTFKLVNGEIVRLICVDAPEKGKQGYEEAKEFLSFLILNKEVRLERDVSDKDEYGRLLRYVYVNDSNFSGDEEIFVNKEIVQQGYAEVFRYGNDTEKCGEIEN